MTTIAFLTYKDFIKELETCHPESAIRVQDLQELYATPGTFLRHLDYKVEAAFNDGPGTYLVRFTVARLSVFDSPSPDQANKIDCAFDDSEQVCAIIRTHLEQLGYDVRPGLFAGTDTAKAVADINTLYSYLHIDHPSNPQTNPPTTQPEAA